MEVASQNPTFGSSLFTDAASSSSALAIPSGVSVAAKRASEEQTEGPAVDILSFGTVNDKDPCHTPNSTGDSNEASKLDPEVLEAAISFKGVWVGEEFCPHRGGLGREEEAQVSGFERLPVVEEDGSKSKRPRSDSGSRNEEYECDDLKKKNDDLKKENDDLKNENDDLKKENDDLKKENDDLKKENDDLKKKNDVRKKEDEVFDIKLQLRQVLSNFEKKPEGEIIIDRIKKEVLELPAAKSEKIDDILNKTSYTKTLRTMHFQGANMALKSKFRSRDWREHHRFPKFSNDDADYQWWDQNFDPKILEKRLGIFREAAEKSNQELDLFMIIKLVSDLNSELHPHPSENELNEKDEVKMPRLLTKIRDLVGPERYEESRKTRFAGP